ncbi:hypothetical protein [Pedobacter faecalis]|uniref:hypothetical protein n=1 Tax=Pedobacter faecalis TaxID=3041495 RepID=UPI002550C188|nr:hypothetical protein [Pedobacter sp. ELA7]
MFLKPVSILLLMSLLSANFSGLWICLGFSMSQKYIARELCVNKDRPQLHCEGKCYLMKKLKQAEEKEQKQERQSQKTQLVQDAVIVTQLNFKQYSLAELDAHVPPSMGMPSSIKNSIFHPPQG